MRRPTIIAAAFLLFFATTGKALAANSEGLTGTELLAMCNSTYDTDYGFCAGYVSALANALLAGPVAGESACSHGPVRSQQLIDIYRTYAELFPENMKGAAAKTVSASIARAFPCQ